MITSTAFISSKSFLFRKRDLFALIVISLAFFLSVNKPNVKFSFHPTWFFETDNSFNDNNRIVSVIKPIITDLEDDGRNEVINLSRNGVLTVISTQRPDDTQNIYKAAAIKSVKTSKLNIQKSNFPIAMTVGYGSSHDSNVAKNKIIVVVTNRLLVSCFDHKLQLLWEVSLSHHNDWIKDDATVAEIALLISPITTLTNHSNIVFVGERVKPKDPNINDLNIDINTNTNNTGASSFHSKHFNSYALDATTGNIIWTHDGTELKSEQYVRSLPHNAFQLDTRELMTKKRNSHNNDWTIFKQSLLNELPHIWQSGDDTKISLSHFYRGHIGAGSESQTKRHITNMNQNENYRSPNSQPRKSSKTERTKKSSIFSKSQLSEAVGKKKDHPSPNSNPNPNLSLNPNLNPHPNVLVVHSSDGVESISLKSGEPIASLSLTAGNAYSDINGDGILDTITVIETIEHAHTVNKHHTTISDEGTDGIFTPCTLVVMSGIPVKSQLFNATLCNSRHSIHDPFVKRSSLNPIVKEISATAPLILKPLNTHQDPTGNKDIFISINWGISTCFSGSGELKWQIKNTPIWKQGFTMASALPFTVDAKKSEVLVNSDIYNVFVCGDVRCDLISREGLVLASVDMPKPPVALPIFGDFDRDGVTDVLIVTEDMLLGYRLSVSSDSKVLSLAILVLGFILLVAFVMNVQTEGKDGGNVNLTTTIRLKRSTDELHYD